MNTLQLVQLSRNDELLILTNPYKNTFDYKLKKKYVLSSEELNYLYEVHIKPKKNEEEFFKEFLKNQNKNQTELFGGIKPIFFTSEEKILEKEKINNYSQTVRGKGVTDKHKIGRKYDLLEKHKNYSHKYFGACLAVSEYDYKDKIIKEISTEEEYTRKEINNFIVDINNYSSKKLENVNYIGKNIILHRLNKLKRSVNESELQVTKPNEKINNYNHLNEYNNNKIKTAERLTQMKNKHALNNFDIREKSAKTFKKINENLILNYKSNLYYNVDEADKPIIEEIKLIYTIVRDVFFIYSSIKNSQYAEEVKRIKKRNAKTIMLEIDEKIKNWKIENNSPVVKFNLEMLKKYISVHKGQNN